MTRGKTASAGATRWTRTLALALIAMVLGAVRGDSTTGATRKLLGGGGGGNVIDTVVETAEDFGETVSEVIEPVVSEVMNDATVQSMVTETVSFAEAEYQASYDWTEDAYHTVRQDEICQLVGQATVDAFESTEIVSRMDEYYDDAKGWTEGAVQKLEETAVELAKDIEKVAEMIAAFFNGLQCLEVADTLQDMLKSVLKDVSSGNVKNLLDDVSKRVDKYKNNLDGPLCESMWALTLGPQAIVIAEMMRSFISTLKDKCPAAMSGSDLPAFALGFIASGDAYALASTGAGIELAIGMDLHGERFCYVAGCAYGGITFGDAGYGGTAGIQVTGYKSISSVPGTANFISLGLGVDIPLTPIGAEAGVTYVYSGNDMSDPIGVAFMGGGSLSASTSLLPASVSLMHGICHTPVCVTVQGTECGAKEPILAIGNKHKNVACEGSSKTLSCPAGKTISVNAASYGRHDGTTCPHSATSNRNCHATNSLEKVKKMCEGKTSCTVTASHGIFGDPCAGTYKYLSVDYECTDSKTALACESQYTDLSCPEGHTISVHTASYGRHDGTTCPHSATSNRNCHASGSMKYVNEMCGGKNKCTVRADHKILGDPCGGTYKYLEVTYGCVLSVMSRSTLTCEGGTDALECPPGYVIDLQDALYGRVDRDVCPHPAIHTDTCSANGVFDKIAAECNGRSSCSPSASNSRFGDPCGGTYKYLSTKYQCVPPSTSTSALACEGRPASMSCPSGQTVSVISASYGRHNAHTCPHSAVSNQNCHASNSLEKVKSQCDGRRSCSPHASHHTFGDPCGGTYKYLEAAYTCVSASASAGLGSGPLTTRVSWLQTFCLAVAAVGFALYGRADRRDAALRPAALRDARDYGARR
jgi:hypothetical protein